MTSLTTAGSLSRLLTTDAINAKKTTRKKRAARAIAKMTPGVRPAVMKTFVKGKHKH